MHISRKLLQRLFALLLCTLLALSLLPSARAEEASPEQGSLSVCLEHTYTADGKTRGLPNVEVRLYLVADLDEQGSFRATEQFQSFAQQLAERPSREQWIELSPELRNWVQTKAIPATVLQRTDAQGSLRLEGLAPGLYLASFGEGVHPEQPATRVGFQDALIALPYQGEGNEHMQDLEDPSQWDYDYSILPKSFEVAVVERIQKIWKDEQDAKKLRPRDLRVTVQYEDGVEQELVLTAEGGWILEFSPASLAPVKEIREPQLPAGYVYRGFTVTGSTVQLTNELSGQSSPEPTTPPSPGGKPGLPQTGQLWWPVPLLLVSGAVLILLGLWRQRNRKNREDENA